MVFDVNIFKNNKLPEIKIEPSVKTEVKVEVSPPVKTEASRPVGMMAQVTQAKNIMMGAQPPKPPGINLTGQILTPNVLSGSSGSSPPKSILKNPPDPKMEQISIDILGPQQKATAPSVNPAMLQPELAASPDDYFH